jgi:predicted acetyltransferase
MGSNRVAGLGDVDCELRYAGADEFPAIAELDGASFGFHYSADALDDARLDIDPARVLVAVVGEQIVGISAERPFSMTMPGGAEVATTGLTWVSVEVTARRRGILRSMVERQVRAAAVAGDAAVILTASEGGIYGRYGFGIATRARRSVVTRRRARLATAVDASSDYVPVTPQAHAALWQTLLAMDLVGSIDSYRVPLDDPLPLLLEDPRGVDTRHLGDSLWVRAADVERLLGTRTYAVDIDCVIEVRDGLLGDGRFVLCGGPEGATCTRTDRAPDLSLPVADLGAVALGGVRLAQVQRAGRVATDDPGRLRRLDRALLADREPAAGTTF